MTTRITAAKPATKRTDVTYLVISAYAGETLTFTDRLQPTQDRDRRRVMRKLGITYTQLQEVIDSGELVLGEPEPDAPLSFRVRRIDAPADSARVYDSFTDAVTDATPDAVVEWSRNDPRFCCLDIDCHGRPLPVDEDTYQLICDTVQPRPRYANRSRSGGVHLYYEPLAGRSALQLAAIAAVWVKQLDASLAVELKHTTRRPDRLDSFEPDADLSAVLSWASHSVRDEDVNAWLAERGWHRGQRLPHKGNCPIQPHTDAERDPVNVRDYGLFCHRCSGKGYTRGSRLAGFVPYTSLLSGVGMASELTLAVRNHVHWSHAWLILREIAEVPESIARVAYGALLDMIHGGADVRNRSVFTAGAGLVRHVDHWRFDTGEALAISYATSLLGSLPICQNAEGETLPDRVDLVRQKLNLASYGYTPAQPVRGVKVYGHHLPYEDRRVTVITPARVLRDPSAAFARPRYLDPADRMSEDKQWATIERYFPGINRNYLTALIAARGVVEGGNGLTPILMVDGVTSGAKTSTVGVAAAILGDHCTEVVWSRDDMRFRQAIAGGARVGGFIAVNEIFKDSGRVGVEGLAAMDALLNWTPRSTTHELYVGPVEFGSLPVFVLTDSEVPNDVRTCAQLGRRCHYWHAFLQVDWVKSLGEYADGQAIERFRLFSSAAARAADSLLSRVIDRFFCSPHGFADICADLGILSLQEADNSASVKREQLRELYLAACEAPDAPEQDQHRCGGRGWKRIHRDELTMNGKRLAAAWGAICDHSQHSTRWAESRQCAEEPWAPVLGVPAATDIRLDRKLNGATLFIRFRAPGSTQLDYRVNGEIV